jgi:MFS transporter, DHA2 family, multidrug resistance protein
LGHAEAIADQLRAGSRSMAEFVGGLPLERFTGVPLGPIDPDIEEKVAPLVEKAAVAMAVNEAWLLLAVITFIGAAAALVVRPLKPVSAAS